MMLQYNPMYSKYPQPDLTLAYTPGKSRLSPAIYGEEATPEVQPEAAPGGVLSDAWDWTKDKASRLGSHLAERAKNPDATKWAEIGAKMFDTMNKEEIARREISQNQSNKSAELALKTLSQIPGMYSLRAQSDANRRGLSAMAGR